VAEPVAVLGDLLDVLGDVGRLGLDYGALVRGDRGLACFYLDIRQDGDGVPGPGMVGRGRCGRTGLRGRALRGGGCIPVQGSRAILWAAAGIGPGLACSLVVSFGTAVWSCNIRSSNKRRRTRAARLRSVHITTNEQAEAKDVGWLCM
jgi:hypothetical protein